MTRYPREEIFAALFALAQTAKRFWMRLTAEPKGMSLTTVQPIMVWAG